MNGVSERVEHWSLPQNGRGQRNATARPGPEPRGFLKFIIKSHKTKMLPAQSAHRNKTKRSRRKAHGNKSTEYHISDLTLRTPYSARDNMCRGVYPRHAPSTACTDAVLAVDVKILLLKKGESQSSSHEKGIIPTQNQLK